MDLIQFETENPTHPGGLDITLSMDQRDRELLAEDKALPVLLDAAMEAIISLRSGEVAGLASIGGPLTTTAGYWSESIRRTSQLIRILEGVRDASIRAHAEAGGSHGQLARALGVARSTAQSQRETLLAKAPSAFEPQPSEASKGGKR